MHSDDLIGFLASLVDFNHTALTTSLAIGPSLTVCLCNEYELNGIQTQDFM